MGEGHDGSGILCRVSLGALFYWPLFINWLFGVLLGWSSRRSKTQEDALFLYSFRNSFPARWFVHRLSFYLFGFCEETKRRDHACGWSLHRPRHLPRSKFFGGWGYLRLDALSSDFWS